MPRNKRTRFRNHTPNQLPHILNVAWYRPEQWAQLISVIADPEYLGDDYVAWRKVADKNTKMLELMGHVVNKFDVDVDELVAWCQAQGRTIIDAATRASFVQYKAEQLLLLDDASDDRDEEE